MERGARIVVRSKHLVQRFAVTSLRLVPRASLADATDLFAPSGPRRLTMVTCAGPYDAARGGYQNLAVVTARPVTRPAAREVGDDEAQGLSSRQAHPRRMPAKTHWRRTVEPLESSDPSAWVEHSIPQAVRAPSGDRPDVTTRAWIRWAEARMRQERSLVAEEAVAESTRVPDDRESAVSLVEPVDPSSRPRHDVRRSWSASRLRSSSCWRLASGGGAAAPTPIRTDQARTVAAGSTTGPPPSPVRLSADGAHTLVRVLASGDLAVEQWVRSRGETSYRHHRVSGALELSDDNRALARATSVTFGEEPASQTIDFVGATVLSLACTPLVGDALPVPCGADAGVKGWRVVRPAGLGDVQVMAQLDLTLG